MLSIPNVVPRIKGEKLRKICEQYLMGQIYVHNNFPVVTIGEGKVIWFEDPLKDRSWRFSIHALHMVERLVNGYEEFGDKRFLIKAKEFILDWYKHNGTGSKSEMAWHDHSTALRLIQICRFYLAGSKSNVMDKETNIIINNMIMAHCEKLADPGFYMPKHNHGLDQDLALLTATLVISNEKSLSWKSLALERLEEQLKGLFLEDGSYSEHSPHYGYLILDRIIQFTPLIKIADSNYYHKILRIIRLGLEFLLNILQPNGLLPTIGDSEERVIALVTTEKMDPSIKAIIDKINNIDQIRLYKLQSNDHVFPKGGYAILKNKVEKLEDVVQITFCSAFHSRVHKHHDDLSFTLFATGVPIFTDPGKFNYDYKSLERNYVISSRAHNSVIVDGEDTQIIRLNVGKSAITSFFGDEDFSFSSGCHCLYPGVIHSRLIVYLKPYDILILDYLEGYKNHKFEQNFIVHSNISVKHDGDKFVGKTNNRDLFVMTPIYHSSLVATSVYTGCRRSF